MKTKCDTDNEVLIKEQTMNPTEWNTKEKRYDKIVFGHWDQKQHTNLHDLNTESNRSKKLIKLNKLSGKINRCGNTGRPLGETDRNRKG